MLLEDLGALIGLVFALTGVTLAVVLDEPRWDGAATLAIGVLLVTIAVILVVEMKGLLIGESATPEDLRRIQAAIEGTPQVRRLIHMRTQHIGPDELLVGAKLELDRGLTSAGIAQAINAAEARVRAAVPIARVIYLEPDILAEPRGRARLASLGGERHRAGTAGGRRRGPQDVEQIPAGAVEHADGDAVRREVPRQLTAALGVLRPAQDDVEPLRVRVRAPPPRLPLDDLAPQGGEPDGEGVAGARGQVGVEGGFACVAGDVDHAAAHPRRRAVGERDPRACGDHGLAHRPRGRADHRCEPGLRARLVDPPGPPAADGRDVVGRRAHGRTGTGSAGTGAGASTGALTGTGVTTGSMV